MSMGAMEKMVANMLGITPESMHKTLSDFSTLASDLKAQLDRIEGKQAEAMAMLEAHSDAVADRHISTTETLAGISAAIEGLKHDDGNSGKRSGGKPRQRGGASGGDVDGNADA